MNPEFWKWSKDERYAAGYDQGYKDGVEKRIINPPAFTIGEQIIEKYRANIEAFASSRVISRDVNGIIRFYRVGVEKGYGSIGQALDAEIAYLNSAAEVGK